MKAVTKVAIGFTVGLAFYMMVSLSLLALMNEVEEW